MSLARLWAGWRSSYIESVANQPPTHECLFCALLQEDPKTALVLARNDLVFAVLNAYPYTSGHLLVAPVRHEASLSGLSREEANALMAMTRDAAVAIERAYSPDGMNLGANLGKAAGAGIPGHLHLHGLPRWAGDTNFLTSVAEARVLPEPLSASWEKLKAAWPDRAA
jgi:ATP adenylyltransferase